MSCGRTSLAVATVFGIGIVLTGCVSDGSRSNSSASGTCPFAKKGSKPMSSPVARGGQLYDKFWSVTGTDAPKGDHPLWVTRPDKAGNKRSGSATWRCKECHGWDYKGADGAYASGSHRTGFGGIAGTGRSADDVFSLLYNDAKTVPGGHGYGTVPGLTQGDLRALAAFVTKGVIDTAPLIDGSARFVGDASVGRRLYETGPHDAKGCIECHGADGLKPPSDDNPTFQDFVGKVANANPYELLHKMRFGQPGTDMPAYGTKSLSLPAIGDLGAYTQTLPKAP